MLLLLGIFIFAFVNFEVKAVREPRINDFMQTRPSRDYSYRGQFQRDSHQHFNYKLKFNGIFPKSHEEAVHYEIELGHTGRKEFIPLMNQREKHEERANGALIAGVLLSKEKPLLSQPLLKYAKEQRTKSQETQRRMDRIRAAGHIDPELEKKDTVKLFDANYKFTHKEVPHTTDRVKSDERQLALKQRKSAKRREDVRRRKDTQSLDAKRRFNEKRKVMKRTRKG